MAESGVSWETVLRAEHEAIDKRRAGLDFTGVAAAQTTAGRSYGDSGIFDTSGLALSGGGIRSAAFCLGAVQALAEQQQIDGIDYLSTVSGGGYTGAAVTTAMAAGRGFPFQAAKGEMRDTDALGHLRDYSNYLIPRGLFSAIEDIAIVTRGIVTNVMLVLPVILLAAAITIYANPTLQSLKEPAIDVGLFSGQFAVTSLLALASFAAFALWALYRSIFKVGQDEFGGWSIRVAWWVLIVLAATAFCELQPAVVAWMYEQMNPEPGQKGVSADYSAIIKSLVTFVTPVVAAVSLFAKRIGEFLQADTVLDSKRDLVKRFLGKATVWLVALALPALLWSVFLLLVYWGVLPGLEISWLWKIWFGLGLPASTTLPPFAMVYGTAAAAIIVVFWFLLDANSNSLHRLYRDRLSGAFLALKDKDGNMTSQDIKLSKIDTARAPYPIVNAALNTHGSREANARGRNADFFFFSRRFCGSASSGFRPTSEFEEADRALSLATAMAISGAAVSSNMGSASVGPLAPTLALLNLRLGYWLRNPAAGGMLGNVFYLAKEIFSRLTQDDKYLYLTDGGHIDNTGLYELLRRRCARIVVIDAEADAQMNFASFVKLQRHARIDLGVRINLRWDGISETSLAARTPGVKPKRGPHCAVGEVEYSNGGKGRLYYVKASLSGDENVYVRDYARRHREFPHETTGDQFFSEEQFEVYRALGFHCVNGLFKGDTVEVSASGVEYRGTKRGKFDRSVLRSGGPGKLTKRKR